MKTDKAIYIDLYGDEGYYLPRVVAAYAMHKKMDIPIVGIYRDESDSLNKVADFFEITLVCSKSGLKRYIQSFCEAIRLICRVKSGEELIESRIRGYRVGAYIFDGIVRFSKGIHTIEKLGIKHVWTLTKIFCNILFLEKQFNSLKPAVYMTHEIGNNAGIACNIAQEYGAYCFNMAASGRAIPLNNRDKINYLHEVWRYLFDKSWREDIPDDYEQQVDEIMTKKTSGLMGMDSVKAFANKRVLTREEFAELNPGFDVNKKVAVIMPHVFSDIPHLACRDKVYRDYYEHYVETIKLAAKIDNVNWVVRPHPSRFVYGEGNEALSVFKKYSNSKNMFWMGEEYSTESLFNMADVVITVAGTCATEFPCLGIPAICAGVPFFSGYGSTINVNTVEDYVKILSNLDKFERLSEEQIAIARKVFWVRNNFRHPIDEYDEMLLDALKSGDCEGLVERFESDYEKTWFYKKGIEWADGIANNSDAVVLER